MIFTAMSDGRFDLGGRWTRCALGRGGVKSAGLKAEGDGASPLGIWPIRRLLWRPDRGGAPDTRLPSQPISPQDGWCDAPADRNYNRPVKIPYGASHERMRRDDRRSGRKRHGFLLRFGYGLIRRFGLGCLGPHAWRTHGRRWRHRPARLGTADRSGHHGIRDAAAHASPSLRVLAASRRVPDVLPLPAYCSVPQGRQ